MRAQRSAPSRARKSTLARLRAPVAIAAIGLLEVAYAAACVDGTTPDCADANAGCGPNLDGSPDRAQPLPEAARPDTGLEAAAPDADADTDADAGPTDADAGDEI